MWEVWLSTQISRDLQLEPWTLKRKPFKSPRHGCRLFRRYLTSHNTGVRPFICWRVVQPKHLFSAKEEWSRFTRHLKSLLSCTGRVNKRLLRMTCSLHHWKTHPRWRWEGIWKKIQSEKWLGLIYLTAPIFYPQKCFQINKAAINQRQ